LVISNSTAVVREQFRAAEQRERNATAINLLSRDLTKAVGLEDMLQAILRHVGQTFNREVAIWLLQDDQLVVQAATPGFHMEPIEQTAAAWAYQYNQMAGRGAEMFSQARGRYLPLETAKGVLGVLGVESAEETVSLTAEQRQLLDSFARLAAMAIERAHLAEQASQALVLRQAEKLQTALLNSISHDLRTPLASITGILSTLRDAEQLAPGGPQSQPANGLDPATRTELLESASEEAARLNRLVGNLLDMTRLEGGALRLSSDLCDVHDLVGAALAQLGERLRRHPVHTSIPQDLPLVPMDFVLMVQVLSNLLDNAAKYSPEDAPLEVTARLVSQPGLDGGGLPGQPAQAIEIAVLDRGIGIPQADLEHIFDKFYRVRRPDGVQGTGLGLSISRSIIEAHGGRIWASQRPGEVAGQAGGTIIALALPLSAPKATREAQQHG
jgi:two-component system sensor histidine kinase KdpD